MDTLTRWKNTREHTLAIVSLLTAEDAAAQSMPDASPLKWHLAHTTWFLETLFLKNSTLNLSHSIPLSRPYLILTTTGLANSFLVLNVVCLLDLI